MVEEEEVLRATRYSRYKGPVLRIRIRRIPFKSRAGSGAEAREAFDPEAVLPEPEFFVRLRLLLQLCFCQTCYFYRDPKVILTLIVYRFFKR